MIAVQCTFQQCKNMVTYDEIPMVLNKLCTGLVDCLIGATCVDFTKKCDVVNSGPSTITFKVRRKVSQTMHTKILSSVDKETTAQRNCWKQIELKVVNILLDCCDSLSSLRTGKRRGHKP
jgi:hypothetical protein